MAEGVEIVRSWFAAFDRGGWRALMPLVHPEFEVITTPEVAIEPGMYKGVEGVRRYFESFDDAIEDVRLVIDGEPIEFGDKVVLAMRLKGRGRVTGIEVERPAHMLWTLRDGMALRLEVFAERAPALAAAGIEPDWS